MTNEKRREMNRLLDDKCAKRQKRYKPQPGDIVRTNHGTYMRNAHQWYRL